MLRVSSSRGRYFASPSQISEDLSKEGKEYYNIIGLLLSYIKDVKLFISVDSTNVSLLSRRAYEFPDHGVFPLYCGAQKHYQGRF